MKETECKKMAPISKYMLNDESMNYNYESIIKPHRQCVVTIQ